jgi:hypothetical protein
VRLAPEGDDAVAATAPFHVDLGLVVEHAATLASAR